MNYYLYILRSRVKATYYIGVSSNPERRLYFHNNGQAEGYTQRYRPWELVYTKAFPTKQEALAAEQQVKDWKSKKMTKYLINGDLNLEDYL